MTIYLQKLKLYVGYILIMKFRQADCKCCSHGPVLCHIFAQVFSHSEYFSPYPELFVMFRYVHEYIFSKEVF